MKGDAGRVLLPAGSCGDSFFPQPAVQFSFLEERRSTFNLTGIIAYAVVSALAYFSPGIKPINGKVKALALGAASELAGFFLLSTCSRLLV